MKGLPNVSNRELMRKLRRLREDNAALRSEVALLRMRLGGLAVAKSGLPFVEVFWEPLSEEDDPPRT